MRKAALASTLTLLLTLAATPTLLDSPSPHSAHVAEFGDAPVATDFIYPVGNPRIAPTFDDNSPNGYQITQMFNNSCDPSLGQGFYYAGQYFCGHSGVDLSDKQAGGPVVATANGVVVYSGYNSSYGNMVRIQHTLSDGSIIYSQYEHMNSVMVWTGQVVAIGQQIGIVGTTGFVTGPHLHFEIKSVNEDGPGYTFGNSALIVGYDEPISYVAAHTQYLAPTATPTLPPPTATATAIPTTSTSFTTTGVATFTPLATAVPATPAVVANATPAPSDGSVAQSGGEQVGLLRDFDTRYHHYVTVTSAKLDLNVRSGPGFQYAPLNSVRKGARLGYLGLYGNGWVHVALPGNVTGYVVREWVAGKVLPALPPVTRSATVTCPCVTVTSGEWPARSGPALHDPLIEPLEKGEQLSYLGTSATSPSWDRVGLPTGRVGWALNWYLSRPDRTVVIDDRGTATPTPTPAPTATPAAAPTPVATVAPNKTANVKGPYVVTKASDVNLRNGPRLSAAVITSLPLGTRLSLRGRHVSWDDVVTPDGTEGYVLWTLVVPDNGATTSKAGTARNTPVQTAPRTTSGSHHVAHAARTQGGPYVVVNVDAANLRLRPDEKSTRVGMALKGTRLILRGSQGSWLYVALPNGSVTGWILGVLTRPE